MKSSLVQLRVLNGFLPSYLNLIYKVTYYLRVENYLTLFIARYCFRRET